jgi:hypothetical protein
MRDRVRPPPWPGNGFRHAISPAASLESALAAPPSFASGSARLSLKSTLFVQENAPAGAIVPAAPIVANKPDWKNVPRETGETALRNAPRLLRRSRTLLAATDCFLPAQWLI